ncbi:hypothetical protein K2173_000536 [Erythroxylum novogranatense]|uniref:Protein kinase domain-containing protein n=1 Tax=Erythroxylum novogranatense TaxID=1862640 RepID=A0AAV8SWJ4_9ROSI|nr:hypothetical protein K2173_000536 [Erythroxylum novogranatense]
MTVQVRGIWFFIFLVIVLKGVSIGEAQPRSFLINCGANYTVNVDGRKWIGDMFSGDNITLSSPGSTEIGDPIYGPLYSTARVFTGDMNYSFAGMQGNYFVRLHFFPFPFENYDVNKSSFSVVANDLKLVSELDVVGEISHTGLYLQHSNDSSSLSSLVKEFILALDSNELVIEFIPSKGSFGFINAIEIVPVGDGLFPDSVSKVGGNAANIELKGRGVESMYRLNVGGKEIKPSGDSGLWRRWAVDSSYMITANAGLEISNSSNITYTSSNDSLIAPLSVYETARTMSNTQVLENRLNMSWKFEVDPGFDYLIRLHFCELIYEKANQRIFRIYINNRTASDNFDVFLQAGGMNKAYHRDYFDAVSTRINTLWIQLGPDTAAGASGTDALLNGLEIFKLSKNGNLAYTGRIESSGNSARRTKSWILWVGIGVGVASVIILAAIFTLVFCLYKNQRKESSKAKNTWWRSLILPGSSISSVANVKRGTQNLLGSVVSTRVGKWFTLAEIRSATSNFDDALVIGVGGFGKVYKGEIGDGILVAIKRSNPQSEQGLREFQTEIDTLSKLRHRHLVSLIGFCEEQNELILVYEYMAKGSLRSHLFGSDLPPLAWKQRLEACIGAARGLHYLHSGADRGIIHRDVKTTNILLDENLVAKMSDFGLSKTGPAYEHTHVSTAVKGSFGYLDPEYFRRQQLTEKSDVYSFGVVLFEVVCARAVINPSLPKDQINLAEWAMKWQRKRSLETIIDPHLRGNYCPESMKKFGEIAEKCLADEGKNRPTMGEVLWHLEYVLQLQEAWLHANAKDKSFSSIGDLPDEGERVAEARIEPV